MELTYANEGEAHSGTAGSVQGTPRKSVEGRHLSS